MTDIELLASVLFGLAVLHTFCVKRFAHWAHQFPPGSLRENLLHFLSETEVVFGLWAATLFLGIAVLQRSFKGAVEYIESLNYTEPKFVFVIMVVAATRPVVSFGERIISLAARLIPVPPGAAFYLAALTLGPLLGSLITEPAAMTLLALLLKRRYFDQGISPKLAYATLGLLFVNVSIGGTLTHFAAPPVLMVASTWGWDTPFMLQHFGWRAAATTITATAVVATLFWKELKSLEVHPTSGNAAPGWLTAMHLAFLALVVAFAHHPDVF
ncbi:MAG TPA: putative Na+/H+ antiporter, partial [Clostridia bacterium]|nr:putative Na+/H+ antiporter [Clostridia bacterium]